MPNNASKLIKLIAQIIISLLVLIASLYILMNPAYLEDAKKVATGFIGLVIGYWLR